MRTWFGTGLDNRFSGIAFEYACHVYWEAIPVFVHRHAWVLFDRWNRAPFLRSGFYSHEEFHVYIKEIEEMTRTKRGGKNELNPAGKAGGDAEFKWCNVELSPEDVQNAIAMAEEPATVAAEFVGLLSHGLSITLKANSPGEFMAACFGVYPNGARFGLSCYGGSPSEAVAGLLVKWYDRLDGQLPDQGQMVDRPRIR